MLKDRTTRAFLAGAAGGVVKDVIDFLSFYGLHTTYRYLDFASVIVYDHKPSFWWEAVFAQLVELILSGFLAIPFAFWVPQNRENYVLKGCLYGVAVWLFLCSMGMIYRLPFFTKMPWQTANSDFVTSSLYGIVMSAILLRLDKKAEAGEL